MTIRDISIATDMMGEVDVSSVKALGVIEWHNLKMGVLQQLHDAIMSISSLLNLCHEESRQF